MQVHCNTVQPDLKVLLYCLGVQCTCLLLGLPLRLPADLGVGQPPGRGQHRLPAQSQAPAGPEAGVGCGLAPFQAQAEGLPVFGLQRAQQRDARSMG